MKRGRKLREQEMPLFQTQVEKRERQVKQTELRKLSSSFSPIPNRKETSNMPQTASNLELSCGAVDCELACRVVVADSIPSEYSGFSLVNLQNFYLFLQIPKAESYLLLFLNVIYCLPSIKCYSMCVFLNFNGLLT